MFFKAFLNPSIYNQLSLTLMQQRGILRNTETISDAFNRVIKAISVIDQKLYERNDSLNFQKKLTKLIYNGTIVLGTPILTNAGREAQVTSACTVLPIHVTQGQADYKRFEVDSFRMLGQALGTGYDLYPTPMSFRFPLVSSTSFPPALSYRRSQIYQAGIYN